MGIDEYLVECAQWAVIILLALGLVRRVEKLEDVERDRKAGKE